MFYFFVFKLFAYKQFSDLAKLKASLDNKFESITNKPKLFERVENIVEKEVNSGSLNIENARN